MTVPAIAMNSGRTIPQLGFGVYRVDAAETQRVVETAIEIGYRHFDGARIYGNEEGLGRGIAVSGLPREEFFVTTKLWKDDQGYAPARDAIDRSLERLGLDHVDLYLIHWPHPALGLAGETWRAFEDIADRGLARSIGVSNFRVEDLDALRATQRAVPAVDQIELHPRLQQRELRAELDARGIVTESWGPLGHASYSVGDIPELVAIGDAHGKSAQQVTLRWLIQEGVVVFPKSSNPERMRANFAVFDFELTPEDLDVIRGLDRGARVGTDPGSW